MAEPREDELIGLEPPHVGERLDYPTAVLPVLEPVDLPSEANPIVSTTKGDAVGKYMGR